MGTHNIIWWKIQTSEYFLIIIMRNFPLINPLHICVLDAIEALQNMSDEGLMKKLKEQLMLGSALGDGKKVLLIFDAVNQVH